MKRFVIFIALCGIGLSSLWACQASAQANDAPMTEAHITRIRANCVEAQSALTQLHASDALLRVNRGQLYESISTKLMEALNNRIALNQMDGARLVSTATTYNAQLADFRVFYQEYEEMMSQTLKINCLNQPVAFYDSVNATRLKRVRVHDTTANLHQSIHTYKTEFELFAKQIEGAK